MSANNRRNAAANVETGDLSPGEYLRAEIERLALDQVGVSKATGVSRQSINNIINDRQPISRAMAGKLARLTGHSSDYWLRASFAHAASATTRRRNEPARPLKAAILVNHQITRAVKDGVIAIEPFNEANVRLASIDLTLDDLLVTTEGSTIDIGGGQAFTLKGSRAIRASTRESVELPQDYIGRVGAMTDLANQGIVTSHGLHLDPGFKGKLQFCLFNAGGMNFELRGGMPIISVEIIPLGVAPALARDTPRRLRTANNRAKPTRRRQRRPVK